MPYKVLKNGSDATPYCVYKIGQDGKPEGETLGCHETSDKAQKQITAVLISESKGEQTMTKALSYLRAFYVRQPIDDDPTAPIRFVASTEGVKADGMNLKTADWMLGRYEKHPVVLYAHDYIGSHLPLGSGKPILDGSRLLIDVYFDDADPFAQAVRAKSKKGLMAGSVGWQTVENGNELLEFSIVPVPLDPDALPLRQAAGRRALQDWLDELAVIEHPDEEVVGLEDNPGSDEIVTGARVGAVLSSRNLRDLEEAIALIKGVVDRAKKEGEQPDSGKDMIDPELADALITIRNQIPTLEGVKLS